MAGYCASEDVERLFIKLESNNFLLLPLLKFPKNGEYGYYFVGRMKDLIRPIWFHVFFCFVMCCFFNDWLLLTRRWKLVEVFKIVGMYRSQQHGRRNIRCDGATLGLWKGVQVRNCIYMKQKLLLYR